MITERDLHEAIAECQGQRNPNANTCIKLAAYYTILDHMQRENASDDAYQNAHSYAAFPEQSYSGIDDRYSDLVEYDGDSDFAKAINGKDSQEMWALMDELMEAVQVINPKLYNGVMRRL